MRGLVSILVGALLMPSVAVASPDGASASPDGASASPDGASASPDGASASPDGASASPGSASEQPWSENVRIRPPKGYVDRSGLTELVFWQAVNGLFAGTLLSTAATGGELNQECLGEQGTSKACADAAARGAGIVLVSFATGVAAPLLLTRGHPVRTADAILVNRGTVAGLLHGYILPFAAGLQPFTDDPNAIAFDETEARWLAGMTFAGDLAGVAAGTVLARHFDPDPGLVSFLGTVHSTTFLAGMSIGSAFPDDLTQDNMRAISAISLLCADLALGTSIYLREHIHIDRHRVFWIDTGSFIGWLGGSGVGLILAGDDQRVISISGTLGLAAGILSTYFATRDLESWRQRAVLTSDPPASASGLHLEPPAPSIRWLPDRSGRLRQRIFVDFLRGTF